jgi:hypothetical protein
MIRIDQSAHRAFGYTQSLSKNLWLCYALSAGGADMKIIVTAILLSLLMSSCSNRGIYEGLRASSRFDCGRLPVSQYEECLERASKSYDQYERERQAL